MYKYAIIGNSVAAIGAVEAIRQVDSKGTILIISEEKYTAYSRPGISYLLAGKIGTEKMSYRDENFYRQKNVELLLETKVVSISPEEKEINLPNKKIKFEKLLIATGGKPFVPPIKGLGKEGISTFTTWQDEEKLNTLISSEAGNQAKKIVVIGAGMIGIKAVESLIERKKEVVLVELAPLVLARALDKEASLIVRTRLEELGVKVITGNEVVEICGEQKVTGVILRDNQKIDCDLVIVAIGVSPNIETVKGTKINIQGGILVNEQMETNIEGIYAAGDVACAWDKIIEGKRPIPIWPLAYRQGKIAGFNMAGEKKTYSGGFPMNSIEFCGIPTVSLGITDPQPEQNYEILKKYNDRDKSYKKIILKDNLVVGAIFVNDISRAGIITGLIENKVNVENIKKDLMSDDFGYISFAREVRKERLEKAV